MNSKLKSFRREMFKDTTTPDIERIAGLFPRGFMSIVAASAGTGKTWFMQYLACRLSCGGNILAGLVNNSKAQKTLIFSGETGNFLLNKRLASTCWNFNPKKISLYSAIDLQVAGIQIMLNTPEGRATIVEILDDEKPDLVFFDTLISFHTADESKQAEMTAVYSFLLKTASAFSCAIVVNHHTRKRNTKAPLVQRTQDDIIGSSAGVRLCADAYLLEHISDDIISDNGMPTVLVRHVKTWSKRIPEFSYSFIEDEGTGLLDFAINWGVDSSSLEWSLRDRVRNLVAGYETGAMIDTARVAGELASTPDAVRKYLDELVRKRIVEKVAVMNKTFYKVV